MRVLGIDPGLNITGYGLLEEAGDKITVLEAGVVRTRAKQPMPDRLSEIAREIGAIVDQFQPEDVVVVEREKHESLFRRLDPGQLKEWLEDYTLSELWEKNVIGGGPG